MKNLLTGILAVAITFSATAQNGKNKKEMGGFKKDKVEHQHYGYGNTMTSKLNLTDDQRTKMKSLNESFRDRLKELNKNESITVKEQKERKEALLTEHKTNIESVLTSEQKQQLESQKKKGREKVARGERLDNLQSSLNLTDNQGQKIKAVNQEFRSKMQSIQKDDQLTSVQKKERVEELQKQHNESIKAVLTEEQKNKLEEQKKGRRNSK